MAAPVYVVRRSLGCKPQEVQATIKGLVDEGYEIVSVLAHGVYPSPLGHDGHTCVIDVVGKK